jgi:pyrrolidone-carboxylate peptidase
MVMYPIPADTPTKASDTHPRSPRADYRRFRGIQLRPRRVVLVTGFSSFAGVPVNPSADLLQRLDAYRAPSISLRTLLLPVSFSRARNAVCAAIDLFSPVILLMFGVDPTQSTAVRVETCARNIWQLHPRHSPGAIDPAGPASYAARRFPPA